MYNTTTSQIISLGVTATKLPSNPLKGRKYVSIQNLGGVFVYIGNALITADTAGTGGFQLLPKATWERTFTNNIDVYGIIATGSTQVLVEEAK